MLIGACNPMLCPIWVATSGHIKGCYKPNDRRKLGDAWARVDDLGEVAVSAESWQGDHFQHFVRRVRIRRNGLEAGGRRGRWGRGAGG